MPADNDRDRRSRLTNARGQGQDIFGLEGVHGRQADQCRPRRAEMRLDRSPEPQVGDRDLVPLRFKRRGDVFYAERLDPEKGTQPEAFAGRHRPKKQNTHGTAGG